MKQIKPLKFFVKKNFTVKPNTNENLLIATEEIKETLLDYLIQFEDLYQTFNEPIRKETIQAIIRTLAKERK